MHIVFRNDRIESPRISLVLLDWSCRESLHILDYLAKQSVPRSQYEVIWLEYYGRESLEIDKKLKRCETLGQAPVVDQWLIMDIPHEIYYHKHLMYNVGVVASRGQIIALCDSDAIVKETFIETIISSFEKDPQIVLHMDQARNNDPRFYPFNYPTIEEVVGPGCVNWQYGKTTGLWDTKDTIHTRNYGACMCALREDIINIGGADEHIDYLGHIAGPYEMTFRLMNAGKREVWHPSEFLYHVWHPGQDGINNYLGPHDGRNVSMRALEARWTGRIFPWVENSAIRRIRLKGISMTTDPSLAQLISEAPPRSWSTAEVEKLKPRFWKELTSCRRSLVALRLLWTFSKIMTRQIYEKCVQMRTKAVTVMESPGSTNGAGTKGESAKITLYVSKTYNFVKRVIEFCLSATKRSRECLTTLVDHGEQQVSLYGTDDIAEIVYNLSFDFPVRINHVYDDVDGHRFHRFRVEPIEAHGQTAETLIVTASLRVQSKIERLKKLGIAADRILVL